AGWSPTSSATSRARPLRRARHRGRTVCVSSPAATAVHWERRRDSSHCSSWRAPGASPRGPPPPPRGGGRAARPPVPPAAPARAERDRAVKAESRARAEAGKATAVNEFLTEDLLTQAAPDRNPAGDRVTLLEVLDRAAETVGGRFRADPESEEAVRQTIARTY